MIFNVNDLTVLFAGLFALFIAITLVMQSRRDNKLRNLIFAAFFLQTTLCCVNTLMYWNVNLNSLLSSISANFFFTLGFAAFLQGPLLYWGTRSVIYQEFHLKRSDFLHLVPALAYPIFMTAIYFRFDEAYKLQFVHSWAAVYGSPYFWGMIWAQKLSFLAYNLNSLHELHRYALYRRKTTANGRAEIRWLDMLVAGFLALNSWHLLILLAAFTSYGAWGFAMGTMENYFRVILLGAAMAYFMRNTVGVPSTAMEKVVEPVVPPDAQELHLQKLRKLMECEKPYLQPNINLERLATRLDMSPKLLSGIINKKLNQNFFEMIRNYRIDEVKIRLSDEKYRSQSINDIMQECGFNSKSVFNQWFKERFGTTPSQFRKKHLG